MGFSERIEQAKTFEDNVLDYFQKRNILSVKNGTEHTHPDFVCKIRSLQDNGSMFVRFAPDGIALTKNGVIHWEAKSGRSIEMDAYKTYMKYHEKGCILIIFVKYNDVYWQYVEKLKLFVPENAKWLNNEGWIAPREHNINLTKGSGTPYKYIDFTSMKKVENFY